MIHLDWLFTVLSLMTKFQALLELSCYFFIIILYFLVVFFLKKICGCIVLKFKSNLFFFFNALILYHKKLLWVYHFIFYVYFILCVRLLKCLSVALCQHHIQCTSGLIASPTTYISSKAGSMLCIYCVSMCF